MDKLLPETIVDKKYRVLAVLGIGGMGIVYRVEQLNLNAERALKTIYTELMSEEIWQRFEQEARAISRLDHGNLIKVFDFGLLEKRTPYYVMEIVHGKTLGERIRNQGPLKFDQVLAVFIPTAFALDYVHGKNIVHRDIKPANIMFSEEDSKISAVKVLDFGIAKMVNEAGQSAGLTKPGEVIGSPNYMSPEQSSGGKIDHRSDIYSLGCTLFESLCGRPPFSAKSHVETIMLHQNAEPPRLSQMLPNEKIVDGLEDVLQVMLEKNAYDRYHSMEEFAQDLLSLQQGRQPHYAKRRKVEKEHGGPIERTGTSRKITGSLFDITEDDDKLNRNIVSKNRDGDSENLDEEDDDDEETNDTTATLTIAGPAFLRNKNTLVIVLAFILLAGLAVTLSLVMLPPQKQTAVAQSNKSPEKEQAETHQQKSPANSKAKIDEKELADTTPFSQGPGTDRTDTALFAFKFPNSFSIGKISTMDSLHEIDARGLVLMPAGQKYSFRPNQECLKHPQLLKRFQPNEIIALDLSAVPSSEDTLASAVPTSDDTLASAVHLDKIVSLNIQESKLSEKSLPYLDRFTSLKELIASGTSLSDKDLAKLKRLRQLEILEARELPQVRSTLKAIAGSTCLRKLCLSNSSLTDADLVLIAKNTNLVYLSLSGNPALTSRGLQVLTCLHQLNHLSLLLVIVTEDALPTLLSFHRMQELKMSATNWTDENLKKLQRGLPNGCKCLLGRIDSKSNKNDLEGLKSLGF